MSQTYETFSYTFTYNAKAVNAIWMGLIYFVYITKYTVNLHEEKGKNCKLQRFFFFTGFLLNLI